MNTFNEGDRVSHPTRGEGTVLYPHEGTGWSTVQFDSGDKYMTDTHMLSLIPRSAPFKNGDRVSHPLHRDGTVSDYSEHSGLYTVELPGNRCYYALEDQLSEPQPDPKFTLQVIMTDGSGVNTDRPLYQQEIETYLTNFPSWDNVETITVTRAKG